MSLLITFPLLLVIELLCVTLVTLHQMDAHLMAQQQQWRYNVESTMEEVLTEIPSFEGISIKKNKSITILYGRQMSNTAPRHAILSVQRTNESLHPYDELIPLQGSTIEPH